MKTLSLMAVGLLVTGTIRTLSLITRTNFDVEVNMDRDLERELERELDDPSYRFRGE